ncbi:hypothetical protein ACFN9K_004457, partial [Salmonella enterica]
LVLTLTLFPKETVLACGRQPSVDPTRSRSECIGGHCFIFISPKGAKNNDNVLSFSILNNNASF